MKSTQYKIPQIQSGYDTKHDLSVKNWIYITRDSLILSLKLSNLLMHSPFRGHTCIIFWKEMMISNQVTHESLFIYEHNGWSQSNNVKSSCTNQYSSMQHNHWLVLPLTMMINCKLNLAPSEKEDHSTLHITKISICICIEI